MYGGGAGGGKTYLGCVWVVLECLRYPATRFLIGRAVLRHLKSSTLLTLFDVFKEWGLKSGIDYNYNNQDGTVKLYNGSEIYLRELGTDPSDPEFDKLGSTEYTGVFIDECSQISTKAKNIAMSRIRYKLEKYNLIPKMLLCSNPTKNFLYYDFYKPWRAGELPIYRKFLQALVQDNSYISPHYIENLKKLDKISKERLLYGNWEYDDDPAKLFEYDNITNIFTNQFVLKPEEKRYLTVDVARFGSDKTVIFLWRGFYIENIFVYAKKDTAFIEREINKLATQYSIPRSQITVDEDGIGGGVVDHLKGIKGFVNNSRAFQTAKTGPTKLIEHNYGNLKAQCYFALADKVNNNLIGCYNDILVEYKETMIEDLEQIKRKDPDKDGKLYVTPKEEIKEKLGRSPDFGDAMMMRLIFEVATHAPLVIGTLQFGNQYAGMRR